MNNSKFQVMAALALVLLLTSFFSPNLYAQNKNSAKYWIKKIKKNPRSGLNHFNLGVIYQRQKRYKKALQQYAKVIRLKSKLTPVAYFNMAKVFKRQGDLIRAEKAVNKINVEKAPENFKKRILIFKAQFDAEEDTIPINEKEEEEEEEERKLSLYWDLAYGTNNNPAFANSFSEGDSQTSGKAYAGYQLWAGPAHEIKLNYVYSSISYSDNSDSNSTYHDISIPAAYYFSSSRIRLIPEYIVDTYAGETYSYSAGSGFDYAHKVKDYYFTVYYQYMKLDVADDENAYLNGSSNKVRASAKRNWADMDVNVGLFYNIYDYDDTDDITSSYKAPSLDITFGYYLGDWDFSLYTLYEKRAYSTDSAGFDRKDNRSLLSLSVGWTYSSWMRLYANAMYSDNSSNDSESSYHQTSLLIGFTGGY